MKLNIFNLLTEFFSPALIRLPHKIKYSQYIQRVRLPNTCKPTINSDIVIMGNGKTADSSPTSPQLKFAFLKIVPKEACLEYYPLISNRISTFCAENKVNNEGICPGDSGSPAIDQSDGTLIGIASFYDDSKKNQSQ